MYSLMVECQAPCKLAVLYLWFPKKGRSRALFSLWFKLYSKLKLSAMCTVLAASFCFDLVIIDWVKNIKDNLSYFNNHLIDIYLPGICCSVLCMFSAHWYLCLITTRHQLLWYFLRPSLNSSLTMSIFNIKCFFFFSLCRGCSVASRI